MSISDYVKETRVEVKHVSWPTRSQAIGYTVIVIGISVALALYLGLFDYIFTTLLKRFVAA